VYTDVVQMSRMYELLNYSEHGTTVDNVLYSCDFSEKRSSTPQATGIVANVRKLIKKNKGASSTVTSVSRTTVKVETDEKPSMYAHANQVSDEVLCVGFFILYAVKLILPNSLFLVDFPLWSCLCFARYGNWL